MLEPPSHLVAGPPSKAYAPPFMSLSCFSLPRPVFSLASGPRRQEARPLSWLLHQLRLQLAIIALDFASLTFTGTCFDKHDSALKLAHRCCHCRPERPPVIVARPRLGYRHRSGWPSTSLSTRSLHQAKPWSILRFIATTHASRLHPPTSTYNVGRECTLPLDEDHQAWSPIPQGELAMSSHQSAVF